MQLKPEPGRPLTSLVLVFLFGLMMYATPFLTWWAVEDSPWYLPYLIWLVIIVLVAIAQLRRGSDDI
ncbi:MAG: UTP--glucose-1-phosphate uridylyltransferase [Proteobacteria bacterium]|nr:MAG: UTP--glucose-1-phosphate uridylyltransferase [Pseudomonadota bacterium]QKK12232.1 MAG: UTP--glucose-1-phosphate uridylyltransferase [Pseudomonadota bacterium]